MNVYFYPPPRNDETKVVNNPYCEEFINSLSADFNINKKSKFSVDILDLLVSSFKNDIVILNWIENVAIKRFAIIQFIIAVCVFIILRIRNVKIIWIMHNIFPHKGRNILVKLMLYLLYNQSDIIITHSRQAEDFLRSNKTVKGEVIFAHHPINDSLINRKPQLNKINKENKKYDAIIWGTIEPYKGILEFLMFYNSTKTVNINKMLIIGRCKNESYFHEILNCCPGNIEIHNRKVDFSELALLIEDSKCVLFPYKSGSISSSGALMDTIALGGLAIGPDVGAFKDLEKEGVCKTFSDYSEIGSLIENIGDINSDNLSHFIKNNTWKSFGDYISMRIIKICTNK
ncbi:MULTISPECIES: hypothetical protein [Klebsiella]|uniref:hypothetical protein n=1 Tax=Klebsiella TaxID=570 RepID=UPI0010351BAB|nr:hypothetical protein [Klebsiella variicola]HCA9671027.1 hypothetical protein [Klebsiella variicola subsp. variicola]MEB6440110.1 hypothetical protein [Klebsiella variicola]MEC6194171.1 hypothetical protein [Klebsiella variicola]HCB0534067.1 hypothetical protein [Klebsiella variicola subsp. variicola]HCQ8411661.1 hypothetical protein [Klebsiella variicola]